MESITNPTQKRDKQKRDKEGKLKENEKDNSLFFIYGSAIFEVVALFSNIAFTQITGSKINIVVIIMLLMLTSSITVSAILYRNKKLANDKKQKL